MLLALSAETMSASVMVAHRGPHRYENTQGTPAWKTDGDLAKGDRLFRYRDLFSPGSRVELLSVATRPDPPPERLPVESRHPADPELVNRT
ncbi:hypothetical protein [Streptomyces subrutilus]|uniref:hypothetical protein n=1 Tax=Streptomyces subrutilus TaxID=36818 RepID=UPI00114D26C6|nr:hypothetical protein [Streptomyces subrutilus]